MPASGDPWRGRFFFAGQLAASKRVNRAAGGCNDEWQFSLPESKKTNDIA